MLSTLMVLAMLSVASAYWFRFYALALMIPVAFLILAIAFREDINSFGQAVVAALLVLIVMEGGYFVGIVLFSGLPRKRKQKRLLQGKFPPKNRR